MKTKNMPALLFLGLVGCFLGWHWHCIVTNLTKNVADVSLGCVVAWVAISSLAVRYVNYLIYKR